ncbi:uncharacterized protein PHACADRAFT_111661 [Phanerochaete carnosa HHB-10118-sp]|uniref:DUF6534 domain-containing protein n=1 Tax=Phanerochaete carnosa (strain HHB-10118-sp) TaxID=650164 RepID=K5VE46_PHACS|nr:uncharacterized protein PHACADRAFT_111661 [Phanerochaete carnosa HHB-10118-sp]EKM61271.1 hypothetical protein PHACADRAFT_111661 [Phanerochaete carnosa HHB-10118-sp]
MICVANWLYLVQHFGSDTTAHEILCERFLGLLLTDVQAVVTFLVHMFFAHRVYSLSRRKWFIAGPIVALGTLRVVSAMSCTAQMVRDKTWAKFAEDSAWLFTTGLSISAVLDFLIALALIFHLQKSKTGWQSMDQIIDMIVLYTVENGLITSIVAVLSLVCWVTMKNNLIFLALHFAISKLYANSFLATLNARKTLAQRTQKSSNDQNQLPLVFPNGLGRTGRFSTQPPVNPIGSVMQITVEKTVHCVTDVGDESPERFSEEAQSPTKNGTGKF